MSFSLLPQAWLSASHFGTTPLSVNIISWWHGDWKLASADNCILFYYSTRDGRISDPAIRVHSDFQYLVKSNSCMFHSRWDYALITMSTPVKHRVDQRRGERSDRPHRWPNAWFLPHCMECRCGLVMRILSVCLSVSQTRDLWQNVRKLCPHSYTQWNNINPSFVTRIVGGGRPLLPEILGQPAPVGAKSPIFNQYLLVAWAQKCETAVFGVKSHFSWRKSATKLLCVKTVRNKVVRHSLA